MKQVINLTESNLRKIVKSVLREQLEHFDDGIVSAGSYIYCKNENGELCVLAGKRGSTAPSCPNMYNVPVGMREENETAQECAQRECFEETNLNIPLDKFKFIEREQWSRWCVGSNFLVTLDGVTTDYHTGNGDGENSKFQWIPISQINKLPWAYNMNKNIMRLMNNI